MTPAEQRIKGSPRMKLHPVTHGPRKNRFCGPSALSAITGKTTDDTAETLRLVSGRRQITGTDTSEMRMALRVFGFVLAEVEVPDDSRITITAWLKRSVDIRTAGRVFLVSAGHHWQVISGRRFVDSKTKDIISIRDKRAGRRRRVKQVFEVLPGPENKALPDPGAPRRRLRSRVDDYWRQRRAAETE